VSSNWLRASASCLVTQLQAAAVFNNLAQSSTSCSITQPQAAGVTGLKSV